MNPGDPVDKNARRRIAVQLAVATGDASERGLVRARERLTVLAPEGAATPALIELLARLSAIATPRCPRCLDPAEGMCTACRPVHARELAAAFRIQAGKLPLPEDQVAAGPSPALTPAPPPAAGTVLDRIDREDLIAMCASKRRYVSSIDADKVARRCEAERPGTVLRSYSCPCCYGWHLTHKPLVSEPVR